MEVGSGGSVGIGKGYSNLMEFEAVVMVWIAEASASSSLLVSGLIAAVNGYLDGWIGFSVEGFGLLADEPVLQDSFLAVVGKVL